MKPTRPHRRLFVVALALALLSGVVAWRLSATAQAHRTRPLVARVGPASRGRSDPSGRTEPGAQMRSEPGGRIETDHRAVGATCLVVKSGIAGRARETGRRCAGNPCVELGPRALEVFGGSLREVMPAEPVPALSRCAPGRLPPGYAVPLGG